MTKPTREEWALIISEGHGLSSADLKAIREGSERIGVSIVNVDEDGNFTAPIGIITTYYPFNQLFGSNMQQFARRVAKPKIEDQAKVNALNSQLARAKMQRNKHLIRELEDKLRNLTSMVQG